MLGKFVIFLAVAACLIGSLVSAYPAADPEPVRYYPGYGYGHGHYGGHHGGWYGGHHGGWYGGHHGGHFGYRPRPHLYG